MNTTLRKDVRHIVLNLCLLLPLLLAVSARAAEKRADFLVPILKAGQAPKLDGRIGPEEWAGAFRIDGFGSDRRKASGYVTVTEERLYLAIRSQLPDEGRILAKVESDSSSMIFDDSIEVWIDPTPGADGGARYQLMTNYPGRQWSTAHLRGQGVEGLSKADAKQWRADWSVANGRHDGYWHCEMTVEINSLPSAHPVEEGRWYIDLWRNWKRPWNQAFMTNRKGIWRFTTEPTPAVRLIDAGVRYEGEIDYRLELFNPTDTEMPVKASLELKRDVLPTLSRQIEESLAAGATKTVRLPINDVNTGKFTLDATATTNKRPVFQHSTGWKRTGPWAWKTGVTGPKPVDFLFAFYPGESRLRLLADVSNLPDDAELRELEATVRSSDDQKPVKTVKFDNLVDGQQEKWISLPELEGEYEIVMQATGPNVPEKPTIKRFERKRFPWEGKALGVTDRVYPPFTPMEVDRGTVRTVLREHEANGHGLWDQVTAKNPNSGLTRPVLARPMRYTLKIAGRNRKLSAGPLELERLSGAEVSGRTVLEAGGFRAEPKLTWEYDGMMRVDLKLLPGEEEIQNLTLEIPLRADAVSVYHAMGAGVRNTITDTIDPRKRGTIFTAKNIPSGGLPKHFCSYIYAGTPGRGLCWFASNDRNWSRDPDTANLRMVRRGDEIVLEVRLINKPLVIEEPRTITFGLLAAPAKPRLDQERWRFAFQRGRYSPVVTSVNWGSISWASCYYPPEKDLLVWRKLREANRRRLSKEELQEVIEHYKPYAEPYKVVERFGRTWDEAYVATLRHNLGGARHNRRMIFYYNRACNVTQPEFLTYRDEWDLNDFRQDIPTGGKYDLGEHKIVPTESYLNFALYWYGRAFDVAGSRGVYWDNMFFRASYNTHTTPAYKKTDGGVVPSTGIWGLRELTKRTFQYMNERGMKPITMPHITSTNILPIYSFTTVTFDWEWHSDNEGTLQDAFSPQYVAAVTSGELAGAWPVVMGNPVPNDAEGMRTFAAGAAVHDVYGAKARWRGPWGWALLRPIRHILENPDVRVYRHWDEVRAVRPMRFGDWQVPTIAYVVPGERALIMVVNWTPHQRRVPLQLNSDVLEMENYTVRDWESMHGMRVEDGQVEMRLAPHAAWLLEVLPK